MAAARLLCLYLMVSSAFCLMAERVTIELSPSAGDMTGAIRQALDKAAHVSASGNEVCLRLFPGEYNISRPEASPVLYHISNTASAQENPDQTKHVGILIKNIDNLTIDGTGAVLITHCEMTPWVIDGCRNVTLSGFTVRAADPSVPEMRVRAVSDTSFVASPHPSSSYRIDVRGRLHWLGEAWDFTGGIAQIYDPVAGTTLRCASPVVSANSVRELPGGDLEFLYASGCVPAEAVPGCVYQMRHSIRNEVAGFIVGSAGVCLSGLNLNFMGNFGIVAQYSSDITYSGLTCAPDPEGGRTCAGFADFLQLSGCRGKVRIEGCSFAGAHDDPINVHGTHLKVVEAPAPGQLRVRFMHPQTFGFPAFMPGDSVALIDDATLLAVGSPASVLKAEMDGDYDMLLTLDRTLDLSGDASFVLENLTWNPDVEIIGNTFTLTPTRGILVTTRGAVTIRDNTFNRIPMPAILVADDARSWFESGPVRSLDISGNRFVNCAAPQIMIAPEVARTVPGRKVHSGISVCGNTFVVDSDGPFAGDPVMIQARSVDGLEIGGNSLPEGREMKVELDGCSGVLIY